MSDSTAWTTRRSWRLRRRGLAIAALLLASCGGSSDDGIADSGVAGGDGSTAPDLPDDVQLPDDVLTADGLHPELAGFPVPDGAVFGLGETYSADEDPLETAVQPIYFAMPAEELVAFFLDALPKAGYQIVSGIGGGISDPADIVPGQPEIIVFERPDGLPGQVLIGQGAYSASQANINVFRSGTS